MHSPWMWEGPKTLVSVGLFSLLPLIYAKNEGVFKCCVIYCGRQDVHVAYTSRCLTKPHLWLVWKKKKKNANFRPKVFKETKWTSLKCIDSSNRVLSGSRLSSSVVSVPLFPHYNFPLRVNWSSHMSDRCKGSHNSNLVVYKKKWT